MADNGVNKEDDDKKGGTILNMSSRIFVANVPPEKTSNKQMRERFEKYGRVLDVYIGKSFAFVQFDSADAADGAIKGETGSYIDANRIECSLAKKQPRSVRQPDAGKPDGGAFRGGPPGYGMPARGRERSPIRGYEDRFEPRRYDELDRYPPVREYRDDPYRRDDAYYRELAEREAFLSEFGDAEDDGPRSRPPPRSLTSELNRDREMRHVVHRRQLEDNEAYHLERMTVMKEEHRLKMEVLNLEKQSLELKIYKQTMDPSVYQQQQKGYSNIPDSNAAASPYAYSSSLASAQAPSRSPVMPPSTRGIGPLIPSLASSTIGGSSLGGMMNSGLYGSLGRNQRM